MIFKQNLNILGTVKKIEEHNDISKIRRFQDLLQLHRGSFSLNVKITVHV